MLTVIGVAFITLRFTTLYEPSTNIGKECLSIIITVSAVLGMLVILGRYSIGPF